LPRFAHERAFADGSRFAPSWDDACLSLVEFENGAVGTIEASRVAAGRKNALSWEINGSRGSIAFDLERLNELQVYLAEGPVSEVVGFQDVIVTEPGHPFARVWWPRGHIVGWEHAHINELYHFLEAVALDEEVGPLGATLEDGYRAAVINDAMMEASASGRKVTIQYEP
jgi:predicted dehydrogenase